LLHFWVQVSIQGVCGLLEQVEFIIAACSKLSSGNQRVYLVHELSLYHEGTEEGAKKQGLIRSISTPKNKEEPEGTGDRKETESGKEVKNGGG
jgi:hypothetical protein